MLNTAHIRRHLLRTASSSMGIRSDNIGTRYLCATTPTCCGQFASIVARERKNKVAERQRGANANETDTDYRLLKNEWNRFFVLPFRRTWCRARNDANSKSNCNWRRWARALTVMRLMNNNESWTRTSLAENTSERFSSTQIEARSSSVALIDMLMNGIWFSSDDTPAINRP